MDIELAAFISAIIGSLAMVWLASTAIASKLLAKRGWSFGLSFLFAIVLGPIAAVFAWLQNIAGKKSSWEKSSAIAIFLGSLFVAGATVITYGVCRYGFGVMGEPLQWPLFQALLISGLLAGLLMAALTQRVAFTEGLCAAALVSILPVVLNRYTLDLSTYGTSTAYFVAILLSGYLILVLALTLGGALGYLLFGDGRLTWSWSYENWVGRRFLMAKRGSHAVSLITLISVVAVMVGCAGMVVVMSVMNGFSSDLRSKILGANAHLMVLRYGTDFSEYPKVIEKTRHLPGVVGVSPFALNEVMVSSENNLTGAVVKGIDVKTVGEVSLLLGNMIDGELSHLDEPAKIENPLRREKTDQNDKFKSETDALADALAAAAAPEKKAANHTEVVVLPGIVIGKEMARSLKVFVGDVVNVVSPVGELGPTGPIPKARAFRLAGVFYSGMYEYDSKFVYIALGEAQSFFGMKQSVTGIEYKVADIEKTQIVAHEINRALGGYPYYTKDWMQMNRNLFSALKLEKIAMFIILMALIFMASLLILVALIMVVIEKGKEIAILKSMGATDSSIMKVFVTYGLSIGGFGAGLGLFFGVALCVAIQSFGIGLDPEVYYITHIPVRIDPVEITLVTLGALIISFLATVPPALFAARLRPVEGLRYE